MRFTALAAAGFLVAACGSGHATVAGTLRETGGPSGASQPGVPGTVVFQIGGKRTSVTAASDGTFTTSLKPGRYEVTGSSPLYGSGEGICRTDNVVVVTSSGVNGLVVACSRR